MSRRIVTLLFVAVLLSSCALPVVKRNYRPKSTNYKKLKKEFSNIVKKKVSILPLFNESPFGGKDLAVVVGAELRKELSKTGAMIFQNRGEALFGTSKEIYAGGGTKLVQLARQAQREGLNFIIFGRIVEARVRQRADEIGLLRKVKYFSEVKVEIRIYDVATKKSVFSQALLGYADEQTYKFYGDDKEDHEVFKRDLLRYSGRIAARKFIPKILAISSRLEWSGQVAKIVENQVYINAGRTSGIYIGEVLKVITEGHEIYDPRTGALIGKTKGTLKGTLEVIDYFGPDGAVCVLHSGGAVQEGDIVTLY